MKSISIILMFLALLASGRSEIIYDNFQDYGGTFYAGPPSSGIEFGDELHLAGTGRTITQFQLEYFGEFAPAGNETVRVRIYANDGPCQVDDPTVEPPVTIPNTEEPGTLLFESEPLPVYPWLNTLTLRRLSIPVTNTITWTVKFEGLTGRYNRRAGPTLYDPPTVGSSYDDFWIEYGGQWQLWRFPGSNPMANFSARVVAEPGTPLRMTLDLPSTNGQYRLKLNGPAYQFADLAYSTNLIDWTTLQRVRFLGKALDYPEFEIPDSGQRYYRMSLVTHVEPHLVLASHQTNNGSYVLEVVGMPGQSFLLEASSDSNFWIPIHASTLTGGRYRYVHLNADAFEQSAFRASLIPTPEILFNVPQTGVQGCMLLLNGARGRDCVIESSSDLMSWTALCTNTFSFTVGTYSPTFAFLSSTLYYRDTLATHHDARYYRSILLPP